MWMMPDTDAVRQPPFFLSIPADSMRTSSNMAANLSPLHRAECFRVDANAAQLGWRPGAPEPVCCDLSREASSVHQRHNRLQYEERDVVRSLAAASRSVVTYSAPHMG